MRFTQIVMLVMCLTIMSSVAMAAGDKLACGLIADPEFGLPQSPLFELLNVELSSHSSLDLLERNQIDKVLQEQSLQAAFSPEGGSSRRQLGQLLKADLLVVMKAGESMVEGKMERYVDVVVSETGHGLRLYAGRLVWDDSHPEATVTQIIVGVDQARIKLAEDIQVIVAVPPFVSDDLTHVYDSLQTAYAEIIMRNLAALPGVHVVDLAEAQALASESQLINADANLKPIMPFFIEGHYRNEGRGDDRKINIHLDASLSGGQAQERALIDLDPDTVETRLRELSRQWLALMFKTEPVAYDSQAEIVLLRNQVLQYRQLGEWKHALDMIETILMIDPKDVNARQQAVVLCGRMLDSLTEGHERGVEVSIDSVLAHLDYAERGCEHLAKYLRLIKENIDSGESFHNVDYWLGLTPFWQAGTRIYTRGAKNDRLKGRISEIGKLKRDTLLEFYEYLGARGEHMHFSRYPDFKIDYAYKVIAPFEQTKEEFYEDRWRGIHAFRNATDPGRIKTMVEFMDVSKEDQETLEYQCFLENIAAIPGDEFDVIVEYVNDNNLDINESDKINILSDLITGLEMRTLRPEDREYLVQMISTRCKDLAWAIENKERLKNNKILKGKKIGDIRDFQQIKKNISRQRQDAINDAADLKNDIILKLIPDINNEIHHWVALDNGSDLLWNDNRVYLMWHEGQTQEIFHLISSGRKINQVAYDGRWIWIPGDDELVIADQAGNIIDRINAEDGLPPGELWVTGLSPGKVFVVGSFDRTWCANVTYGEKSKKMVDVFHEARIKEGQMQDAGLTFRTRYIVALKDDDGSSVVLVGRGTETGKNKNDLNDSNFFSLIIHPDKRTVTVSKERFSSSLDQDRIKVHNNRMYWIAKGDEIMDIRWSGGSLSDIPRNNLLTWGAPDFRVKIENITLDENDFNTLPSEARLLFIDDFLYMVKRGACWLLDLEKGQAIWQQVAGGDAMARSGQSNFFGAVALNGAALYPGKCFQIVTGAQPESVIQKIDEENKPQGKVIKRNILFGHDIMLRIAPLQDLGSDHYTTTTVSLVENGYFLDPKLTSNKEYVWVEGWEQQDPLIHEILKQTRLVWPPLGTWEKNGELKETGVNFFPIKGIDVNDPPKGIPVRIIDAEGNPVAGGNIYELVTLRSGRGNNNINTLRFWSGKTDDQGNVNLINPHKEQFLSSGFQRSFIVSSQKFGSVSYSLQGKDPSEWRLHTIEYNAANTTKSVSGIIHLEDDKPLSNATLICYFYKLPDHEMPVISPRIFTWKTSDQGLFSVVPHPPISNSQSLKELPLGTIVYIGIIPDEKFGLPAKLFEMIIGQKYKINYSDALSSHKIVVQNGMGQSIDLDKHEIYMRKRYVSLGKDDDKYLSSEFKSLKLNSKMGELPILIEDGNYYLTSRDLKSVDEIHVDALPPTTIVFNMQLVNPTDDGIKNDDIKETNDIKMKQLITSYSGQILDGISCLPANDVFVCRYSNDSYRNIKKMTPEQWTVTLSETNESGEQPDDIVKFRKWLASIDVARTDDNGFFSLPVPIWDNVMSILAFGQNYDLLQISHLNGDVNDNKAVTVAPAFIFPYGETPAWKPMAPPSPFVIYDNIEEFNRKNPATTSNVTLFYEGKVQDAWGKSLPGAYVVAYNGTMSRDGLANLTNDQWQMLHLQNGDLDIMSDAMKPILDIFGETAVTRTDRNGKYRLKVGAGHSVQGVIIFDENILGYMFIAKGRPTGSNHTMYFPPVRMYASAKLMIEPWTAGESNSALQLRPIFKYADDKIAYNWVDVYRGWTNPGDQHFIYDDCITPNKSWVMNVPAEIDFNIALQPDLAEWKTSPWSESICLKSGEVRDLGRVRISK